MMMSTENGTLPQGTFKTKQKQQQQKKKKKEKKRRIFVETLDVSERSWLLPVTPVSIVQTDAQIRLTADSRQALHRDV